MKRFYLSGLVSLLLILTIQSCSKEEVNPESNLSNQENSLNNKKYKTNTQKAEDVEVVAGVWMEEGPGELGSPDNVAWCDPGQLCYIVVTASSYAPSTQYSSATEYDNATIEAYYPADTVTYEFSKFITSSEPYNSDYEISENAEMYLKWEE